MSATQMIPYSKIQKGDVVTLSEQSKLALVFAVLKSNDTQTISLKLLPIHIHAGDYWHPNDKNTFMIPNGMKEGMHLSADQQYRVEFVLEDRDVQPEDIALRYAKGSYSHFSVDTLARMDRKIREERRTSQAQETQERVYVFHKDIPTHVKERAKPGKPHIPNISLFDAHAIGLLDDTLFQTLAHGTYGKQTPVTMLGEVYGMANSAKPAETKRFASVLRTGLMINDVSLRTAFNDGALNESASFLRLRAAEIDKLGLALQLFFDKIHNGVKVRTSDLNRYIDEYDREHFCLQPFVHAEIGVDRAWKQFKELALNKPQILRDAGVQFMYPA